MEQAGIMRNIINNLEVAKQTQEKILNEEFVSSINELTYQPLGKVMVEADATEEEISLMVEGMFANIWQADADQ